MSTTFDPYSRGAVREVLHGHQNCLDREVPR